MAQQPNMNQLLKQAQQMQAEMAKAQEQLKDETVEASAGGGMVKVTMTGDMQLARSRSIPRPSTPRTPSCSRTWSPRRSTRPSAPPRSWRRTKMGGIAGLGGGGAGRIPGLGPVAPERIPTFVTMYAGPISRLIAELSKLPGIGQRTAQRLAFHILRADDDDALGLADAIREVKEKVGLCEVCFNLAEGPAAGSARTPAATSR